jgi:hypothetical protein
MYQLIQNLTGDIDTILRLSDKAFIPPNPDNTDYQEFLRWKEEGNEPLPADEV